MEWLTEWVQYIIVAGLALVTGWLGFEKWRQGKANAEMERDLSLANAQKALRESEVETEREHREAVEKIVNRPPDGNRLLNWWRKSASAARAERSAGPAGPERVPDEE